MTSSSLFLCRHLSPHSATHEYTSALTFEVIAEEEAPVLARLGGHYCHLVCVTVWKSGGKRNLGWSFKEMQSNTLLIDAMEGN